MRDFVRPLYKFQNDILELHVALAKKSDTCLKNQGKPLKNEVFTNFEGVYDEKVFFV